MGRIDESTKTCRQAVEIMRSVVAEDPGNPKYQCQLAVVINDLAMGLNEAGELAETETCFREAVAIQEPLVLADPANREYRLFLSNMQFNLGMILDRKGRHAEAEPWYQQAVEGYAGLVRRRRMIALTAPDWPSAGWDTGGFSRRRAGEQRPRPSFGPPLRSPTPCCGKHARAVLPVHRVLGLSLSRRRLG